MEREISFSTGFLSRINYALTDLLDFKSREKLHYTIPGNVDLSKASFSFGQYKGRLFNQVWKLDKRYIKQLSKQEWLANYPLDKIAVHTLLENQRLFKS